MRANGGTVEYVLGHSAQELDRLEHQSQLFAQETRALLSRAGLKPGMKVLDVGCGVGDVAMIAAEMVGPEGSVLGIDRASQALSVARARAEHAGHASLGFEEADIFAYDPTTKFDAAIGRFILMHVADPVGVLKRLTTFLNPGGAVAFLEMDIDQAGAIPQLPLLSQCIDWITATYRHVGVEPNMGSGLYAAFRAAGLAPNLSGTTRIESGANAAAYGFAAQTVASLMPAMDRLGIATSSEIGIDTLAARLREASLAGDHCILMPRLIGAWATKA
ncbi:MAG TPA: class I SAM-dependent methyltransferase [Bauldia sp.]|nr:class I SAM-dependent methyltransferase [Bauldia sp.]